ncbi:MAG: sodium-dependent transporter [Bacteroidaceae bacterium]|nr:sodium-dependent transporter [Bacteroidaceae bacterium]
MKRENFGSKLGAILAAAGSAVGLGNIWRFPIETGRNGGAAFILVYIACIILLGMPIMMSEFLIGRHTQSNTARAYQKLAPGTPWKWVGRLGVFTGFFILSYYAVVAGWTIEYAVLAVSNQFQGMTTKAEFEQVFTNFSSDPLWPIVWLIVFILLTHFIIVRGVARGIERWSKVLMPMLFIIIAVLVVCSVSMPGASSGVQFLLQPDFSKVNSHVVLSAMGQAFYSLSLGMGCLCTYASYFDRKTNLSKTTLQVCVIDTMIALMAGFIIFPAAAAANYGLTPQDIGPSLIFITLPNVFQQAFGSIPVLAYVFSVMFYLLLIVAALTSTISMHEVVTSYMAEEFHLKRNRSALIETCLSIFLGIFCALSFGCLSDVKLFDMTIFDIFDWTASNICLPVGGMFIAIFTGWYLDKQLFRDEVTNGGTVHAPYFKALIFVLRYITPLAILAIILGNFGLF